MPPLLLLTRSGKFLEVKIGVGLGAPVGVIVLGGGGAVGFVVMAFLVLRMRAVVLME